MIHLLFAFFVRILWGIQISSVSALAWSVLCILLLCGCRSVQTGAYQIGLFSVRSTNDFAEIKASGFNLIFGGSGQSYLDAAQSHGLQVMLVPGTGAGPHFQANRARAAVQAYDQHPALWAWYVCDEPDLNNVTPMEIQRSVTFIKHLGARKPTTLGLFQGSTALDYAHLTDILMIDRYPVPWLPLANFPQHVRMARLALGQKKPLFAVIQAFDWAAYPTLLPGEKNLRPPSRIEMRCMTYAALQRQANGLFYYCFEDPSWKIRDHPQVWSDLKAVVAEVREREALFLAEHVWWNYKHDFADRSTRYNAALEASVSPAWLRVNRGSGEVPGGDYVLAVNTTELTHQYRLKLPVPLDGEISVLGENRTRSIYKNWVEDEFQPYAVHVYGPILEVELKPN